MDFGIHVGPRGCMISRRNMMALATNAESQGYAIIGVADHIIAPVTTAVRYPYTADGVWPGAPTACGLARRRANAWIPWQCWRSWPAVPSA